MHTLLINKKNSEKYPRKLTMKFKFLCILCVSLKMFSFDATLNNYERHSIIYSRTRKTSHGILEITIDQAGTVRIYQDEHKAKTLYLPFLPGEIHGIPFWDGNNISIHMSTDNSHSLHDIFLALYAETPQRWFIDHVWCHNAGAPKAGK